LALAAFPDARERIFSLMVLGAFKVLFTAYYVVRVDYQPMDVVPINQRHALEADFASATNADDGQPRVDWPI
jgi:hypothetical protein